MKTLYGVGASPGIATGPVFFLRQENLSYSRHPVQDTQAELKRLEEALDTVRVQLQNTYEIAKTQSEKEELIFAAQASLLDTSVFCDDIQSLIREDYINAETAVIQIGEKYAAYQEEIHNDNYYSRAAGTRDLAQRILSTLLGNNAPDLILPDYPVILAGRDLSPSDTIRLDKSNILGFCMSEGGLISHAVILAKALGLPAVVGLGPELHESHAHSMMAIDGERGLVIFDPDESTLNHLNLRQKKAQAFAAAEKRIAYEPAVSLDNHPIRIFANINSVADAQVALNFGAEGVGLLRTEYLYLDRTTPPSEEEQLDMYQEVVDIMEDRPVTVRTLDITADPPPPYLNRVHEDNPFLGSRGIRICLQRPGFFKVQLRALLRANTRSTLRILLPMVAALNEVRRTKELLNEARQELEDAGIEVHTKAAVGIMVEVPSTVTMADQFAREVDFFSIGTNDLTQYTMAAERTNPRLAHLHDSCHPAILRQVWSVVESAHKYEIPVGLCGELAGDPEAVPILFGLGLDELSMAASLIPRAKAVIRRWTFSLAQKTAREVLDLDSAEAIRQHIRNLKAV